MFYLIKTHTTSLLELHDDENQPIMAQNVTNRNTQQLVSDSRSSHNNYQIPGKNINNISFRTS